MNNKLTVFISSPGKNKTEFDTAADSLSEAVKILKDSGGSCDIAISCWESNKKNLPNIEGAKKIYTPDGYSYQQRSNFLSKKCKTPYFIHLEGDDKIYANFLRGAIRFISFGEADIFLTMPVSVDGANNFIRLGNGAAWVVNYLDDLGVLTYEKTKANPFAFNMTAAIYKSDSFTYFGGIKEKYPVFYMEEFLLRGLKKGAKVEAMPLISVTHKIPDRLFDEKTGGEIPIHQITAFRDLVDEEHLIDEDRDLALLLSN
jgi:hypothetical protein